MAPVCVTDKVDVVIVDVIVLPNTMVLVTLVCAVEETTNVDVVRLVASVKVAWKVTGKLGIVKTHVYPV